MDFAQPRGDNYVRAFGRNFAIRRSAFALISPPVRALSRVARATSETIPEDERHHLYVTMHHGHWQGGNKHKGGGDQHLCATCLQAGVSQEDMAMHVAHGSTWMPHGSRPVWLKY